MRHAFRAAATIELPRTLRTLGAMLAIGSVTATPVAQAPAFEVASIKRHNLSIPGQTIGQQGDRFIAGVLPRTEK